MGYLRYIIDRILYHDKWAVGLVELDPEQLLQGVIPQPVQWIAPRFGEFIADPFLFTHNETDYLLYELFTYATGNGKIAVAEVKYDDQGRYQLVNEQFIIEEPFHQSYPFVFSHKDTIYCLPEQSESNSLRLYRASDFPSTWVFDSMLINDFPVVDPTLFSHDGLWWVLGTRAGGQQDSVLYAWYSEDLHGPWQPHAQNPVKTGLGKVRPAGPVFTVEGQLYRPVQGFEKRYGDAGLLIEKIIELSPTVFCEETVASIRPFPEYPRGLHHVFMGKHLAAVDGYRFASAPEVVLKRIGILRKKLAGGARRFNWSRKQG